MVPVLIQKAAKVSNHFLKLCRRCKTHEESVPLVMLDQQHALERCEVMEVTGGVVNTRLPISFSGSMCVSACRTACLKHMKYDC